MKDFLKKNIAVIILFALSTILFFLANLTMVFMAISMVGYFVAFLILAIRFRKKYKLMQEYDPLSDYFDASKFDYEEEVYYIGAKDKKKQEIKNNLGMAQARLPYIICLFISVACLFMAGYAVFKMFF